MGRFMPVHFLHSARQNLATDNGDKEADFKPAFVDEFRGGGIHRLTQSSMVIHCQLFGELQCRTGKTIFVIHLNADLAKALASCIVDCAIIGKRRFPKMPMSVNIPADVQPFLQQAVASGAYANEQEAVSAILRVAASSLEGYQRIKAGVTKSLEDENEGRVHEADFDKLREHIQNSTNS